MEETKKMKCYKRLTFKQFSKSQVLVAHSFWVICRKVRFYSPLWSFVWRRRIGVQFWYTNMAAGNQQKHLEFTFSTKALSFHLRASIRAHKHIFQYLKFKRRDFFSTRQHSYFGVTHGGNSEGQIVVFLKWNMLRDWKLVQRFTFCLSKLSATFCK